METFEIEGMVDNEGKLHTSKSVPVFNRRVRVLLMVEEETEDRKSWLKNAEGQLSQAYGADEPEYSLDMVKEWNPKYNSDEKG